HPRHRPRPGGRVARRRRCLGGHRSDRHQIHWAALPPPRRAHRRAHRTIGPARRHRLALPGGGVGSRSLGMLWGEHGATRLRAIAARGGPLAPQECAARARLAAALIEPGRLARSGPGEAVLLWRDEHSEAWLNLWWQPRDTGYHDHTGSCVGVHVIEGRAWNEPLTVGEPPEAREYGPGESFWFPGEGIHRMDHQAG